MKPSILFLLNTGQVLGGGEISLLELMKYLDEERFQPLIVCPCRGEMLKKLEDEGHCVQVVNMVSLRKMNLFKILTAIWQLYRYVKKNKIALVHANGSRCAVYAVLACKILKVPVIWHVRVMGRDKWFDPFLSRFADKIIVISEAVRERFRRNPRALQKTVVIYNGIDLERFHPASGHPVLRDEFGLEKWVPMVGMVGRMDHYKDFSTFLYAAREVMRKIPDAQFFLVGSGELMPKMMELAHRLQLEKSVHFLGNREDIIPILASLDVFVLASKSEGFGRALAEAMAMQKPVVASRVGGIVEIVEDGISGILVPVKDYDAMAMEIVKLLKNSNLARQMGAQARKRIEQHFSIDQHVRQIEAVYEQLLKRETH